MMSQEADEEMLFKVAEQFNVSVKRKQTGFWEKC
jgi:hypothetical protein